MSNPVYTTINPRQIREGDQLIGADGNVQWIALENARPDTVADDTVRCDVQHLPDGGCSTRVWDASDCTTFNVMRPA